MLLLVACGSTEMAEAQLQLVHDREPQCVFSGDARNILAMFHNPDGQDFTGEIQVRIFQTSSATAVLWSDKPWKRLVIPADETVLASGALDFPAVKVETRFLIQWLENTNRVIGRTEIWVYPTNLLAELNTLAGDEPLGVLDPQNQIKPLLKNLKVTFTDLGRAGLEEFSGRLAILGPFQSKTQMREGLADKIKTLAKHGTAIVWITSPRARGEKLMPSFYSVRENTNAVVVVQPDLVAALPKQPQSQLNLVYFCRLALNPEPLALSTITIQPEGENENETK